MLMSGDCYVKLFVSPSYVFYICCVYMQEMQANVMK